MARIFPAICTVLAVVVAACIVFALHQHKLEAPWNDSPTKQELTLNLSLLHSGTPQQKQQAVRFVAENVDTPTPPVVHALSQPLLLSQDAALRQQALDTLRKLASRNNSNARVAAHEPQVIAILNAAYAREKDPLVRRSIIESVGELNDPEAVDLLNRALEDKHPAVREAAQLAKLKREQRLLTARSG
jgi:hypothetical protein